MEQVEGKMFLPVFLPASESGCQCSALELKRQKAQRLLGFSKNPVCLLELTGVLWTTYWRRPSPPLKDSNQYQIISFCSEYHSYKAGCTPSANLITYHPIAYFMVCRLVCQKSPVK